MISIKSQSWCFVLFVEDEEWCPSFESIDEVFPIFHFAMQSFEYKEQSVDGTHFHLPYSLPLLSAVSWGTSQVP